MIVAVSKETLAGERRVALVPDGVKALVEGGPRAARRGGRRRRRGLPRRRLRGRGRPGRERPRGAPRRRPTCCSRVQPPDDATIAGLREGAALRRAAAAARRARTRALARGAARHGVLARAGAAHHARPGDGRALVAGDARWLPRGARSPRASMPRIFPMLVTAAGTITAARAFVIGAGVAGLQAIATAKRLGAIVEAYDTRAAAAEQIESLGARFVELRARDGRRAGRRRLREGAERGVLRASSAPSWPRRRRARTW